MLNGPMACPNPIHDNESNYDAGMDIMPYPDKPTWWYCNTCKYVFVHENGISKLIGGK